MWTPFSLPYHNSKRSRSPRRVSRPVLEALEGRVVLSVAFDSVHGVGNDTASILPWDNAVDSAGNTYVTGLLYGTMDFDPSVDRPDGSDILTPRGTSDAFVAKYAPDGTLAWARRFGSDFVASNANDPYEAAYKLALDGPGNVYVAGDFMGKADFGPITLTSAGSSDAFVAKLDAGGNLVWAKSWGGATRDFGHAMAVDAAGNVISAGETETVFANNTASSNGIEVHKFSATGAPVWSDRFDNHGDATGVATDAAGNLYVCGSFSGTIDFNPDPRKTSYVTGGSGTNGYVLKLTASGALGWASPFIAQKATSDAYSFCKDIALDGAGNVVVAGQYHGPVDFDPSSKVVRTLPDVTPTYNGFVAELSSTGALAWATPLGGAPPASLAVDASGSAYVVGTFQTDPFTPGYGLPAVTTNGLSDVFVAKLTRSGTVSWTATFGGTGSDLGTGICVDASGEIYVTGTYRNTVDFDPDPLGEYDLTNAAYADMFLLKLKQS